MMRMSLYLFLEEMVHVVIVSPYKALNFQKLLFHLYFQTSVLFDTY